MKILLVTTNYGGGAGIACRRQHQALLANGFDSNLLILNKVDSSKEKNVYSIQELISGKNGAFYFSLLKGLNLLFNKAPVFFNKSVFINGPFSLFRIDKLSIYKTADVIHLHWVPKIISWRHLFSDKQKKFIWTMHDMNPFSGGNHYSCDYDYSKFNTLLQKNAIKKANFIKGCNLIIVSPSVWLAELAKQSIVFKEFKIVTIPNCLDTSLYKPIDKMAQKERLNLLTNKKIILFVAENPDDKRKGMHLLLEAVNKLKTSHQICLLVIGKYFKITTKAIEIKQLGVINNEEELVKIYNTADFFIVPSIEDNLPNTIVESLSCGIPVLGFDIGGLPDVVIPNQTGLLAPAGNTTALAENIDQFVCITDYSAYSKRARALAEDKFSQKHLLKQLLILYNS